MSVTFATTERKFSSALYWAFMSLGRTLLHGRTIGWSEEDTFKRRKRKKRHMLVVLQSCMQLNISCQYKPTQNITVMFLFDLQTVAFLVLKNARCIAEIRLPCKRVFSVVPLGCSVLLLFLSNDTFGLFSITTKV